MTAGNKKARGVPGLKDGVDNVSVSRIGNSVNLTSFEAYEILSMQRHAAWSIVYRAVRTGKLAKPDRCERCGQLVPADHLHGHHDDYARPLDVRFYCVACHRSIHAEMREKLAGHPA